VRHAIAREPGTMLIAIGATPGVTFSPSPWEQKYVKDASV
jgi:hypothetical protein